MMYNENFVTCIKANNRILRENNGNVFLPFGSEYSILLKNLRTQKALITELSIDGEDVINRKQLIIEPNSTDELEGFVNGMNISNKFKFIEKTQEISDYRGDRINDGIIVVKFKFELLKQPVIFGNYSRNNWKDSFPTRPIIQPKYNSPMYNSSGQAPDKDMTYCTASAILGHSACNDVCNDNGITVHGSESDQTLQTGHIGLTESIEHTISLCLKGCDGDIKINKPITVKTCVRCNTCGKSHKYGSRFCSNCGTALQLFR